MNASVVHASTAAVVLMTSMGTAAHALMDTTERTVKVGRFYFRPVNNWLLANIITIDLF